MRYMVAAKPEDLLKADYGRAPHPKPVDTTDAEMKAEEQWEKYRRETEKKDASLGDSWIGVAARESKAQLEVEGISLREVEGSDANLQAEVDGLLSALSIDTLSSRDATLHSLSTYVRARGVSRVGSIIEEARKNRYALYTAPIHTKSTVETTMDVSLEALYG